MSQMEMFADIVTKENTILAYRSYWNEWDAEKRNYDPKKAKDNELLSYFRNQLKNFTYA